MKPQQTPLRRICLTPMKNEEWIVQQYVRGNSLWADELIVADQGSTDRTYEMLQGQPKVRAIKNESASYDEAARQRLLIDEGRRWQGPRVLIALDADEILSANTKDSPEWDLINQAAPGTVLRFRWVNVLPGFKTAWIPNQRKRCGFIDNGEPHQGQRIHSQRVPGGPEAPVLDLHDMVIIHLQYVSMERMERKHRWYQAWEYLNNLKDQPLKIYRQYHHMHGSWQADEMFPVDPRWIAGFQEHGVDLNGLKCEPITWWDKDVLQMLQQHGPARFRKLDIWGSDWTQLAKQLSIEGSDFRDPRSPFEKAMHALLRITQKNRGGLASRVLEKFLRMQGW